MKARIGVVVGVLVLVLMTSGCGNGGTAAPAAQAQQEPAKSSTSIFASFDKPQSESTDAQIAELKNRMEALESSQASVSASVLQLQSDLNSRGMATFDPIATQGYAPVDTGIVRLMIKVKDITPFADGVKVTLLIGNPNAVTLDGLSGTAYYGPSWDAAQKEGIKTHSKRWASDWSDSQQHTDLQISETLLPGRWTPAVIILPSTGGAALGRLVLELRADKVAMYGG